MVLLVLGLGLRFHYYTSKLGVYAGPWEYNLSAKTLIETGRMGVCLKGSIENCAMEKAPGHPGGYTIILSALMLLGLNLYNVLSLQIVVSALTGILLFFAVFLALGYERPALFSAAFYFFTRASFLNAMRPNLAVALFKNFFIALSLVFVFLYLKEKNRKTFALAALSLSAVGLFKLEGLLFCGIGFLFIFLLWGNGIKKISLRIRENWAALLFCFLAVMSSLLFIFYFWLLGGKLQLRFFHTELAVNLRMAIFLLQREFTPLAYFFPVLAGLAVLAGKTRKIAFMLLAWFFAYLGLLVFFQKGPTVRLLQESVIPFTLLCGIGASELIERIGGRGKTQRVKILSAAIIILAIISPVVYLQAKPIFPLTHMELQSVLSKTCRNCWLVVPDEDLAYELAFWNKHPVISMRWLSLRDFKKRLYFVETRKCHEVKDLLEYNCNYLIKKSDFLFGYKELKIYRLNLTMKDLKNMPRLVRVLDKK